MADTTITALPAVTVPATTDVFPVDQSGTTKKESIAQILSLVASSTAQTLVYVNAQTGSDTAPANGSATNPYLTITNALSSITTNSITKPFAIIAQGIFSEAAIAFKPFVDIVGLTPTSCKISVTGAGNNVVLAAGWSGVAGGTLTLKNINFSGSTNLNLVLTGVSGSAANISIIGCNISGASTLTARVNTSETLTLIGNTFTGNLAATNWNNNCISSSNIFVGTYRLVTGSTSQSSFMTSQSDIYEGSILVSSGASAGTTLQVSNCSVQAQVTTSGLVGAYQYDSISYPANGFATGSTAFISTPFGLNKFPPPVVVSALSYTTNTWDVLINVNFNGAVTISLNDECVVGQPYFLKDISGAAATNNITIVDDAGGNVEGNSSYVINTNYAAIMIIKDSDGNWWIF